MGCCLFAAAIIRWETLAWEVCSWGRERLVGLMVDLDFQVGVLLVCLFVVVCNNYHV